MEGFDWLGLMQAITECHIGKEIEMKAGMKVKVKKLESTDGMMIAQSYLNARKKGAHGIVQGYVPGHGGDVWWVKHEDGTIAAYCYTELADTSSSATT